RMVSSDRIVLFDHDLMLDLMKSEALRTRLGVPDQLRLPAGARASRQRALYPRRYGLSHYIERFQRRLEEAGVVLHLSTCIEALALSPEGSPVLRLQPGAPSPALTLAPDHCFW